MFSFTAKKILTKHEFTYRMVCYLSPSSRGLGLRPFTAATGVRLPLGTPSEKLFHNIPPVPDKILFLNSNLSAGNS